MKESDECLIPMRELKKRIPLSDTTFWRMEKRGEIDIRRIGSRKFVTPGECRRLMNGSAPNDADFKPRTRAGQRIKPWL